MRLFTALVLLTVGPAFAPAQTAPPEWIESTPTAPTTVSETAQDLPSQPVLPISRLIISGGIWSTSPCRPC